MATDPFSMTFEPFESNEEPPPLPKPKPKDEGVVPKSGKIVPPTDVAGEMKRAREQAVQFGGMTPEGAAALGAGAY